MRAKLVKEFLFELSSELKNKSIQAMKDRGMINHGKKWEQHYLDQDLKKFIDIPIFKDKYIIYGFRKEDDMINISYGSPRNQEFNKVHARCEYHINLDKYMGLDKMDRKSARIFSKIAKIINPSTKYSNIHEFPIIDE